MLFDFDQAILRPDARMALGEIAKVIQYYAAAPVEVNGHTDAKGDDAYNQTLSEQRAASVREYLVSNFAISTQRLKTQGLGEKKPIAPNTASSGADNPAGRQKNRRVEVVIENQ